MSRLARQNPELDTPAKQTEHLAARADYERDRAKEPPICRCAHVSYDHDGNGKCKHAACGCKEFRS